MSKLAPKTILSVSLIALGISANLQAAAIIYESFSDTNSTLAGNAVGTGLTGTWSNTGGSGGFDVSGTSLSYGSLTTTGGSAIYVSPSGTGNRANAATTLTGAATPGSLENAGLLAHGSELWFSVLQRVSTNTNDDRHAFAFSSDRLFANASFTPAGTQGIGFAMNNSGSLSARVSTDAGVHVTGTGINRFSLAETIMIVGRINWGADAVSADTVTLFLPGTNLQLGTSVSTASAVIDQSVFDTITFFQRQQTDASVATDVGIDEIRFGATMTDVGVIPEPSAAILAGFSLVFLLRRRR